jgi:flagellum-specific peptidoglycan hydrolase FlgJ
MTPSPQIVAAAKAAQLTWHIPASISIAQYGLESAWGKIMPTGSLNPFGMKALVGQPSVTVPTHEVYKGVRVLIQAAFRKFDSISAAFDAHGKLLATAGAYAHARTFLPDAIAFGHALTGVYATDPAYGDMLAKIIRGSSLLNYDHA